MRRIIYVIGFVVWTVALWAQERATVLLGNLQDKQTDKVLVVAHRGDWRNAPENSLQAFKNCIEMGVDMIEIDLKKTKDGELVLMHDETIDRTTNGKGKPSDYTLEELRQFRLKNGLGRVTFHPIPTFKEVLDLTKGKILINIDKGYDYFQEVYALLEQTGTVNQAVIKSSYPYAKVKAEQQDVLEKVIYMPIIDLESPEAEQRIEEFKPMRPVAIECVFKQVTPDVLRLLKLIRQNGSKVWINSLWPSLNAGHDDDRAVELEEPDESWGWILEQGATLIQTDRPAALIRYLDKKGRR
ncbi:MAG: glycerophosphodiester phosphodiesterase family protein [Parabacteroides sp.]